jgi:DNA processing protein
MPNDEILFCVAFARFSKIGPIRFFKLRDYFSSVKEAFEADKTELMRAGLEENIAEEFQDARKNINPEKEWESLEKENIKVCLFDDALYPPMLKEIYDPPYLLFYKGALQNLNFPIAAVGTRKMTRYGELIVPKILADLARSKMTIVSGLALGVDSLVHRTTLRNNGVTWAIIGSGLDKEHVYPASNQRLAEEIVENGGAVISEYPIGTEGFKSNFPHRNRIIAGISLATVVIEAAETSGALITARLALEANREVFAVPGSITNPASIGPNNLIKMGAYPATCSEDVLNKLNLTKAADFVKNKKILPETREEAAILEKLSSEPTHIDELHSATGLPLPLLSSTLTMMEMKGKVRDLGGMNYVLAY